MFHIGFLPISIWDILDILIVGYLAFHVYKLLKGSIAFNIFIGVIIFYTLSWLVSILNMELLSSVLNQFISVGFIIFIIIFQQEVRRFLLFLGNTTLKGRFNFWDRMFDKDGLNHSAEKEKIAKEIQGAVLRMSKNKTGALIVLAQDINLDGIANSCVVINASIKRVLLESIFHKESPLHDGAVIISRNRIQSASCVLPVSENNNLPKSVGLRHRAGVGITEKTNAAALIVSEETGKISFAFEGILQRKLSELDVFKLLMRHL